MSLQDELKNKTLALISQQMAGWVVDIQRHIGRHQEGLIRALDELNETVARYDEKIDETAIERAVGDAIAAAPPPAPVGPSFPELKASLTAIEKGSSLSEVLTYLVNEVSQHVNRAAMFIVKGPSAIGWYSRGIEPAEAVKQINVPLNADTMFRAVYNGRSALRASLAESPATMQLFARLGGRPGGALAVPLVLRDKLAAILYCDVPAPEIAEPVADLIEVLVLFAAKIVDVLSVAPRPPVGRTTTAGNTAERAAAIRAGGDEVRERAGVPRPVAPPPPAPPTDEGSSTVMFNPVGGAGRPSPQAATAARPAAAAAAAAAPAVAAPLTPELQKAHEDAKRFARLVVSEIKLYNETKVNEGRRQKDLYERLKEDIERGRQMYSERVAPTVRDSTNYFYDELVRILAGGDAGALGPM
jgi:hypothetical protein